MCCPKGLLPSTEVLVAALVCRAKVTKYRGIKICARDVADPLRRAGRQYSFARLGREGREPEPCFGHATNMGQSRLKSDEDAEDDKCCRFATYMWNDLSNTRLAG